MVQPSSPIAGTNDANPPANDANPPPGANDANPPPGANDANPPANDANPPPGANDANPPANDANSSTGANDAKPPAGANPPPGANDANPPAGTDVTISGSVIYDSVNRSAVEYWTTNTVTNGRITILAEEKTNRTSKSHYSSDGKQSNYFVEVQDPVTGIYRREIKPAGYVADLLPKWREAENRKIFYTYTENKTEDKTPARRKTFHKTKSGPVTKFHWFACHDQNQADQDTMSRNPTTKCCVEFEKEVGPQITLMNELKAKFMQSWDLQELIVLAAERDKMPIPQKRLPKKYTEKNLCYHNRNEVVDPFKREPSTWREIKNESYAERGITIDERAMSNGPVQYSGITTGEDGQPANRDIERIISLKLEKEKKITDLRFERIESEVHGLKNDLGKHTLYLEEILGLLKEKSPTTQTSGHTSAPISEKLKDTLGGFGNGSSVREGTLPPYTSPMPPQRRAAHIQPSIEV